VQTTLLVHLGTLREVLEKIHFHEDEAAIKRELHGVLDSLIPLSKEGRIERLEVYNEEGHKVTMKQDDLIQFVNDTRFMVTG
jgi:hypothetical protein